MFSTELSPTDFAKNHGKVEVVNVPKITASNSDIYSRLFVESKSVDLIISTSGSYDERRLEANIQGCSLLSTYVIDLDL